MGTLAGPAVGSRIRVEYVNESTWGEYVAGNTLGSNGQAMGVTSESIKHTIGSLTSATLTSDRGIRNQIRGSSDIGGDINFELAGDIGEYSQMMKQAICQGASGSDNYLKINGAVGHWGLQVAETQTAGNANLLLKGNPDLVTATGTYGWDSAGGGDCVIVNRDVTGALTSSNETYTGITSNGQYHSLTIAAVAGDHLENAWAFPLDTAKYNNTYLHYIECGQYIGTGMNVDILRDIALFVYTGMKVNTMTLNFNPNEIVTGTFSLLGKDENCGGTLLAEVVNAAVGPVNIDVSDVRSFNGCSTEAEFAAATGAADCYLLLGHEGGIEWDGVDVVAGGYTYPSGRIVTEAGATGAVELGTDLCVGGDGYFVGTAVASQTSRANDGANNFVDLESTTLIDVTPYSGFEASCEQQSGLSGGPSGGSPAPSAATDQGLASIEVVSCSFTLDNGLYTDKFVLGTRFRAMLPEQRRNVTGTISFELDNLNQYRKFYDGTEFGFCIRTISTDTQHMIDNTGAGSVDVAYSHCFYFHRCKYEGDTPNIGGPDLIISDMPFRALVHGGNVTSPVASDNDMPFPELTVFITTSRSADLWT